VVLKFDGLAAGKGVAVCLEESQGEAFLDEVFVKKRFGEGRVLVEEFLTGPEVSIFAAVVDDRYLIFTPARDYKRIGEDDQGDNTGGMGAVASRQLIPADTLERIEKESGRPDGGGAGARRSFPTGFLYFGLMLTPDGPKVIEYNCRFGDPECQAVMPLVKGDLANFCLAGAQGDLRSDLLTFDEGWSVCVVLASAGYPASSRSGDVISGLDRSATHGSIMPGRNARAPTGRPTVAGCSQWSRAAGTGRVRSMPRMWRPTRWASTACNGAATLESFTLKHHEPGT
jgi:phosphoribosylamine--glycine ligase